MTIDGADSAFFNIVTKVIYSLFPESTDLATISYPNSLFPLL